MSPALRALPLAALDLGAAAFSYQFLSPSLAVLLGTVGALVLGVVLVQYGRLVTDRLAPHPVE
jgi:hypothetical protein